MDTTLEWRQTYLNNFISRIKKETDHYVYLYLHNQITFNEVKKHSNVIAILVHVLFDKEDMKTIKAYGI